MAGRKWFKPLSIKSIISERLYYTIFQILSEEEVGLLKILYQELREQLSIQDYRIMKRAIREEKKKNKSERKVLSVLVLFESACDEKKEKSKKRRNKTKNLKKRAKRRERMKQMASKNRNL